MLPLSRTELSVIADEADKRRPPPTPTSSSFPRRTRPLPRAPECLPTRTPNGFKPSLENLLPRHLVEESSDEIESMIKELKLWGFQRKSLLSSPVLGCYVYRVRLLALKFLWIGIMPA